MPTTKNINDLVINKIESQEVYDYMVQNDLINEDELYLVQGVGSSADIDVDSELSSTSENPVQNKVINEAINNLNTLVGDTAVSEQISEAIAGLGGVGGGADWNQDDPNGAGYIANRTHYTEQEKWNEIFSLHTDAPVYKQFSTSASLSGNYYIEFETPIKTSHETGNFEAGKTYRVHINGADYELVAKAHYPNYLGDYSIVTTSASGDGTPFMLDTLKLAFPNRERPEVVDLVVYDYYAKVQKLDEKYIDYKPGRTVTGQEFEVLSHQYDDYPEILIAAEGAEIFNDYLNNVAIGEYSHSEGSWTYAVGYCSHAEGDCTYAFGDDSHAEGFCTQTFNYNAHAEGAYTIASGEQSHAEGDNTKALGESSHAEGSNTFAGDWADHTEGDSTVAVGNASHAEGEYTAAVGYASHAEGSGDYHRASVTGEAGSNTYVLDDEYGIYSGCVITYSDYYESGVHTYGIVEDYDPDTLTVTLSNSLNDEEDMDNADVYIYYYGVAAGDYSHVEGTGSIALGENQHVQGQYNIPDEDEMYAHIVGNGDDHESRSNAHTLDWDGNAWFAGDVYVGGNGQDEGDRLARVSEISSSVTVDTTLTLEGQAADAKAVGDAIGDLNALVGDTSVSEQISTAIEAIDFDAITLITVEDIDTICGGTIRAASEVLY